MPTVRYFAAAAEAAGVEQEHLAAATVADLVRAVEQNHGEAMARVLPRCSLLHDGRYLGDRGHELAPNAVVDVLPPFAGG